jgi:hypothetical protein
MPSAPGLLSITTRCPSDSDIDAAMILAMTPVASPVPNATSARTGLDGTGPADLKKLLPAALLAFPLLAPEVSSA